MPATSALFAAFTQPVNALVNGASRGIGLALVKALLGDPSVRTVLATSRQATSAPDLGRLAAESNGRLALIDMDVTREASVVAAAAGARRICDRLHLIINCAGLLHEGSELRPEKRLADVSVTNLQRSFAVNAIGPLLVAKHFQALLPQHDRAVLANLSARVGSIGDNRLGGWYSYRASKAAQNMITRNLSIELKRRTPGLICIALHPGTVDTALSRPFQSGVPKQRLFSAESAAQQLLSVIDGLTPHDNGEFFAWDAQRVQW